MPRWMPKLLPNANSPSEPRAVVHREHLLQIVLALRRRWPRPHARARTSAGYPDQVAVDDAGNSEANVPFGGVLDGAGEELAAGEVALAVAVAEDAAAESTGADRCRGRRRARSCLSASQSTVELLLAAQLAPAFGGVFAVEEAGLVDELLEVVQRHLGVLRVGLGGEERQAPAESPFAATRSLRKLQ